jgi:hypothetical protein
MKKSLAILLATVSCLTVHAQFGTVLFRNVVGGAGGNAPDYLCDSTTRLVGSQYMAEMLAGRTPIDLKSVATTPFSSTWAGYFIGQTLELGWCGHAFIQINIWNTNTGSTFLEAQASGLTNAWAQSAILELPYLGGDCCEPPCTSQPLEGLTSLRLNGPYSPPKMGITLTSPQTIRLDWPYTYGLENFVVEQAPNLQTTNWSILTNKPTVNLSTNLLTIPAPTNTTFFRLVAQ